MLKKLIDTNIFIDRFRNPEQHREVFLSEGLVYLSALPWRHNTLLVPKISDVSTGIRSAETQRKGVAE
jgi:hypothetical protein